MIELYSGMVFFFSAAYAAWFWRSSRPFCYWTIFVILSIASVYAWWFLLRRKNLSMLETTVIYDVVTVIAFYVPLILFRESSVSTSQILGLVLVALGAVLALKS